MGPIVPIYDGRGRLGARNVPLRRVRQRLSSGAATRNWVLALLFLIYLSSYIDRTIIYLLQEPIKHEFGLSDRQLGLLGGAAFGILYAVLGLPIARLAERRGRVGIIVFCLVVWSVLCAACGAAQAFGQLLILRAGLAIGEAGCSPPAHSIISDYFPPERRATAFAVYVTAVPVGQMLGAMLGGTLAQAAGWRATFVLVGLPGLVLAVLLWLTVREPVRGQSDDMPPPSDDQAPPSLVAVLRHARGQPAFLHVLAGSTVGFFAYFGITNFMASFFLRSFGLTLAQVGMITGLVSGLMMAAGVLGGGAVADRVAQRDPRLYLLVPAIAYVVCVPFYFLAFSRTNWTAAMLMLIVPGILVNSPFGATYGLMHNSFPARMRATIAAILLMVHALLGLTLGSLCVGALSDWYAGAAFGDAVRYLADCRGGAGGNAAMALMCRSASAVGIRNAILTVIPLFLWAALHFVLAARHIRAATPVLPDRGEAL